MRKSVLGAALGAVLITGPTMAMAGGFVGLNYTQLEQNDRYFGSDRFDTGELFARIGGHVNKYFTTELRLGTTVDDKSKGDTSYRFDYHVGAYAELGYQFSLLRPYLLAGYTFGREQVTRPRGGRDETEKDHINDFSYGAGVDLYLSERLGINAEYVRYYDIGNVTYKGPSAGVFYRF